METRWIRRLGPGIAAIGAMATIASTTAGAPPPTWEPPPCPDAPAVGESVGAWFRHDPLLENGVLVGQRLTLGRAGDPARRIDLEPESYAAGPAGGTVLLGTDDGRASHAALIDLAAGCRWPLSPSADVVRTALLAPDGRAVYESRVDRRSRVDLGVWRRSVVGREERRIADPIPADGRFGPTWLTGLAWSDDGSTLVVSSCGETACRHRLIPTVGGPIMTVADPRFGSLVGLTDGHLVTRGACRGLPCPVVSVAIDGSGVRTLHEAAGLAVLVGESDGRATVVYEPDASGRSLAAIGPDGRGARTLPDAPDGLRLVAGAAWSASAAEHRADRLVFGPDGRIPVDGGRSARLRGISETTTVSLDEVDR